MTTPNTDGTTTTTDTGNGAPAGTDGKDPAQVADAPKTYDEATVKALRNEAAGHRTKSREFETRATTAETELATVKAQVPALETRATTAEADALRYRVALEAGLPLALAERLRGADEAALKADAETLKSLAGPPAAPDLGQGQQGGPPPSKVNINDALRALAKG